MTIAETFRTCGGTGLPGCVAEEFDSRNQGLNLQKG